MNVASLKLTRICISVILVSLIVPCLCFAKIDIKDMAGLWLFEEGSGKVVKDSSGNKNDGEFDKGPKWEKGKFGGGLEFDGTPNFVTVPHDDIFNFETGDFTMGCWMDAKKDDAYVVIKRNGGGFWAMSATIDRPTGVFIFEGGGQHIDDGKTKILKTGWHHCVVVRKKGEISLYVDGNLETKRNVQASMDNPAFIRFGGWGSENHVGGLDEVFISKKDVVLTEDDIKSLAKDGWEKTLSVSPGGKASMTWGAIKTEIK